MGVCLCEWGVGGKLPSLVTSPSISGHSTLEKVQNKEEGTSQCQLYHVILSPLKRKFVLSLDLRIKIESAKLFLTVKAEGCPLSSFPFPNLSSVHWERILGMDTWNRYCVGN